MAKTATQTKATAPDMQQGDQMPVVSAPRMPYHPAMENRFGIDRNVWRVLTETIWPGAKAPEAIFMAWEYCKARNLDPFKRQVHIVPVWSSEAKKMVETVWPGISELRTTATRTGAYAGMDAFVFGETVTEKLGEKEVTYPEWCRATAYKIVQGHRVAFVGPTVYWREAYATAGRSTDAPNAMWSKRPSGQLQKCAEAAALRMAFPEELGGQQTAEEMAGRTIDGDVLADHGPAPGAPPRPTRASLEAKAEPADAPESGVDALVDDLKAVGHTPAETTAWLEANETAIKALAEDDYALLMDRVDVKTGEPQHEGN
jgi:phage recombination protein Bet